MIKHPRRFMATALAASLVSLTAACPATAAVGAAGAVAPAVGLLPGSPGAVRPGSVLSALTADQSAGGLTTLSLGGTTYTVPDAAMPYLGRGLDPDLFQDSTGPGDERAGRLPVTVSYRGGVLPALPGITLTRRGAGSAEGYLTAASARRFGAGLARQYRADRPHATYGRDGMFGHGVSISLAVPPASHGTLSPAPRHSLPTRTLTVTATNLAGQPDTGDTVIVTNVDNSNLFNLSQPVGVFRNGVARFKVPAGHYWALGMFGRPNAGPAAVSRITVLPQFSVLRNATVHTAEPAATSKITMVAPRPATVQTTDFMLVRTGHSGPPVGINWENDGSRYPIRVSPTATAPNVGSIHAYASQQLASAPGAAAVPYWYAVNYADPGGTIPAQRYVVRAATLATVSEHYYQAGPVAGPAARSWAQVSGTPPNSTNGYVNPVSFRVTTPGRLIEYLGGNMPAMTWSSSYQTSSSNGVFQGDEYEPFKPFRPGERLTDSWNAYPLHPAVGVNPDPAAWPNQLVPAQSSADRSGNTLWLSVTPFGDNEPDHWGAGFSRVRGNKITGSYRIDQDGKQIASGNPLPRSFSTGLFGTHVRVPARPSVISFTFNAARTGPDFPLSTASHTVWTWRSAPKAGVTLPPGWYCYARGTKLYSKCAVQPMMTLDYTVAGMSLAGQVRAGRQAVSLTVGHLQLAKAAPVTRATMSVSFDGGKTWHAARVTGSHGHYLAVFGAPAGAYVMTRATARDAGGGSVSETITRAFQVAR